MKTTIVQTDVLIVGTGIAGLSCALELARLYPDKKITLLDKSFERECNTKYAQGGLAAVMDKNQDSFQAHIEDTLKAGNPGSLEHVVNYFVQNAPKAIDFLEKLGVGFDKDQHGNYQLGREGGHSQFRIVHHKDWTGKFIQDKLWQRITGTEQIQVLSGYFAKDLLGSKKRMGLGLKDCWGIKAYDLQSGFAIRILASMTILATGGCGQLFLRTTNPNVATGDGVAMAIRAGANVRDLHYYQFHPTALYSQQGGRTLLLTEALRGAGAYIVNDEGERFLWTGDQRGELATRDVVTCLIGKELTNSGKNCAYLDARHLGKDFLEKEFPQVIASCGQLGLHPAKHLLPILPAAHYQCGGIEVDIKGQSSINGLYAIGECASTGIHGRNRLASNSLTEGVVFARELAKGIEWPSSAGRHRVLTIDREGSDFLETGESVKVKFIRSALQKEMSQLMYDKDCRKVSGEISNTLNVWRQELRLEKVSKTMLELENMLDVAIVLSQSLIENFSVHVEYN